MVNEKKLIAAVYKSDLHTIINLLEEGTSINACDDIGYTSLHAAIDANNTDVFKYLLLQPGLDINAQTHTGKTPLYLSTLWSRKQFAQRLLAIGADVSFQSVKDQLLTPLHAAAANSDLEMVSMLVYYGADANAVDADNYTPFMTSLCRRADIRVQELLMELEVDYNRTAVYDMSTLLLALENQSELCIELIKRGANVHHVSPRGNALELSFHSEELFDYIWQQFDPKEAYRINGTSVMNEILQSILHSLSDISRDLWLKRMNTIFFSENGMKMLTALTSSQGVESFTTVLNSCCTRRIAEDDLYPLLCVWLSCGVDFVHTQSLITVHNAYGFNTILELLLNMRIESRCTFRNVFIRQNSPLLDLICDVNDTCFENVLYSQLSNGRCLLDEFCDLLQFGTPKKKSRDLFYYSRDPGLYGYMLTYTELHKKANRRLRSMTVPSLIELSRNAAKKAVIEKYNIDKCRTYYWVLNRLHIPDVIKGILSFKVPVNKFDD